LIPKVFLLVENLELGRLENPESSKVDKSNVTNIETAPKHTEDPFLLGFASNFDVQLPLLPPLNLPIALLQ
jgi:hypothetical protein